ncbi:MAG: GAF domain-containing SpoIIE family protein phosphatase [Candidatus Kryptonium sp.]
MNDQNSKIFSFGQILLALGFAFILLVITLVKKIFPFPALEFASNILFSALLITLILIVQPFAKKFENNPVDGTKFISIFLFPLVGISFAFKNIINIQREGESSTLLSFSDILASNIHNLIYIFLISISFSIFLKIFFHERNREAKVKFAITLLYFVIAEFAREVLDLPGLLSQLSLIFQLILFMWVSFRIPWIISLSKNDKYKILLFSFFVIVLSFLLQSPFITGSSAEGMRYYSPLFFSFVHFYLQPFLIIYFFFVFGSTIFHLPTGEIYERKIAELSTLQNIGKLVAQVLDIKEFTETAVKIAMEITNSKSGWVELKIYGQDRIYGISGIEESEMLNLMGKIASIKDGYLTSLYPPNFHIENFNNKTILMAPLISHGKISGYLYLLKENQNFIQDEVNLALAFADQIAIGVENSMLIQESIEKERLAREFELARQMQKKLLPKVLPESEKFEIAALSVPAFEVGGDYYDFVFHDDGNISVIIADVSGKGISAAFYMAEIKGIFQSLAKIYPAPFDFLVKANETIYGHIDKKFFITLVYAYFDLRKDIVHLARAGHLPPILVKTRRIKLLKIPGAGIGLMPSALFRKSLKPVKLKIGKNDLILFYSDGIIEAMNEENEEFGYRRLENLIISNAEKCASELVQSIFKEVTKYQGEMKQIDDITILAVKWKN